MVKGNGGAGGGIVTGKFSWSRVGVGIYQQRLYQNDQLEEYTQKELKDKINRNFRRFNRWCIRWRQKINILR